jgi:YHS domain-containing protein
VIRRFVMLLGLVGLAWALGRVFSTRKPAARSARKTPGIDTSMVRDRVCNTFVPRSRALVAEVGGDRHFFCSERCRSEFLGKLPA